MSKIIDGVEYFTADELKANNKPKVNMPAPNTFCLPVDKDTGELQAEYISPAQCAAISASLAMANKGKTEAEIDAIVLASGVVRNTKKQGISIQGFGSGN